jgi:hypothetical protein
MVEQTLKQSLTSAATPIHPDKIRAYLATDYRLGHSASDIVLTVGQHSPRLAALFARHQVDCGAFITAYNPRGTIQSGEANDAGHARLERLLRERGLELIEGSGSEAGTDWPAERSWFALGLGLEPARALGTEFDQDAIVWAGADAVPQLILLREALPVWPAPGASLDLQNLPFDPAIAAMEASNAAVAEQERKAGGGQGSGSGVSATTVTVTALR